MSTKHTPPERLPFKQVTFEEVFVRNHPQLGDVFMCVMFCQPHLEVVSPWQSLQKQGGDFLSFTYQPMNMNDVNQIKPDKMDSEAGSEPFCTVLWFASCYRHQPR